MKSNKILINISLAFFLLAICPSAYGSLQNEQETKAEIKDFTENYNQLDLNYITSGKLNHLPYYAIFGLWVTSKNQETIDSGRAMAVAFLKAYMKELEKSKNIAAIYARRQSKEPEQFPGKLSLKNVGLRIAYWNDQVERPKAPFLSEIDFYDNTFRYYEADSKTQGLKLVLEESYEKAVEQINKQDGSR